MNEGPDSTGIGGAAQAAYIAAALGLKTPNLDGTLRDGVCVPTPDGQPLLLTENYPALKWGEALDAGFQILPDVIVRHSGALKLTPTDVVVLLHLTMHWWFPERLPFPRSTTIARRMNVTARTVQRSLSRLRKAGLLTWEKIEIKGAQRRRYDLSPLVEKAKTLAARDQGLRQQPHPLMVV